MCCDVTPSNNVDSSNLQRSRYWYWVFIGIMSLIVGTTYYYIFQAILINYPWIPLLLWLNVVYLIHLLGTNYNHHSISAILAEHWELSSYQLSVMLSVRSDRKESLVYSVSVLALLSILAFPYTWTIPDIPQGHGYIGILCIQESANIHALLSDRCHLEHFPISVHCIQRRRYSMPCIGLYTWS